MAPPLVTRPEVSIEYKSTVKQFLTNFVKRSRGFHPLSAPSSIILSTKTIETNFPCEGLKISLQSEGWPCGVHLTCWWKEVLQCYCSNVTAPMLLLQCYSSACPASVKVGLCPDVTRNQKLRFVRVIRSDEECSYNENIVTTLRLRWDVCRCSESL